MNMMTGLERAWVDVMIFVPRFVGFLFTLLVGYFVSAWLGKAVTKILNSSLPADLNGANRCFSDGAGRMHDPQHPPGALEFLR